MDGKYKLPCGSSVHYFVRYRLGEEGLEQIMAYLASKIYHSNPDTPAFIDSTPNEASRYDPHADFNPHYKCKMYKTHILHLGDIPAFMEFSDGNESDSTYAKPLIARTSANIPSIPEVFADAGYDSFEIYGLIWGELP